MDILTLIAGILTAFVVFGHFIMSIKLYLSPMMKSDFDLIPKATMQCVFHYVSAFLVLSAIALLVSGFNVFPAEKTEMLIKFIGLHFIAFTLVQIGYALKSKVEKPLVKMFQWTLFLPIGILCLL